MIIENFLGKRLKAIQKRNNFDPNDGIGQIISSPEKLNDYIIFREYINLIKKCKLKIEINYDELGLSKSKSVKVEKKPGFIYFARLNSNNAIWKVGYSTKPYKRKDQLQTGNHDLMSIIYVLPGDINLESKIKKLTIKRKTKGGTEWRTFDNKEVRLIVSELKKNCFDYILNNFK